MYKQRLSKTGGFIQEAVKHDVHATKKAVTVVGNKTCGSCYGAEDSEHACCNTCDEVSVVGMHHVMYSRPGTHTHIH